jgi:hypothetical protein
MDNNILPIVGIVLVVLIIIPLIQRKRVNKPLKSDALAEAEVYLAYGRKKEAKELLEKYLLSNPGDAKAVMLLKRVNE